MEIDFNALAQPSIRNLTPYQAGKPIEELERELKITSAVKLASNENPLGASPHALAAATTAIQQTHIYPDANYFELKKILSEFLAVTPHHITVGNGSENILQIIAKAYIQQHDTAILSQYAFMTIKLILQSLGANIKTIPAEQWGHDINGMINAIDDKTRIVFLVNPNNPTGTYVNSEKFHELIQSVPPYVLLVVDEAYSEYIQQADFPDTLSYLERYPNLIITRTFSKVYGLAGLRIGYALSSPIIADILNRARLPFNVNSIGAKAAIAAIHDQEHVQKSVLLNHQGMKQLEAGLKQLGLSFIPSLGNFITIDVGEGVSLFQKLLLEGVIIRPLKAYDMPKHIRVTVGTYEQNQRFLTALQKNL